MSSNLCAMTGQSMTEPVVSKKTGHLFQKSVIVKHLNSFPYCPITNQQMSLDDLIQVQGYRDQRNKPQQSALSYLNNLKSQYDTLVLQTFYLRKSLKKAKQELTNSLTANEAAQKVIAKLLKQNEQSDKQLQKMEAQLMELKK